MKKILFALILFLSISSVYAQDKFEAYIKDGIQHHDKGDFDKAIESYEKALEIDPKSTLANYEIALSYFSKGKHKKAIKYCDKVLEQNGDHITEAYMTKGSALDVMGKTEESIKLFEEAIEKTKGHYLLYYNLALNYYKINKDDLAEQNVINAIAKNQYHPSSHLLLASINNRQGNVVKTLLPVHYFLFLEPKSSRSIGAYEMLQSNFAGNVSEDEKSINITLSSDTDSEFSAAELMISMLEASKHLEENKGKTEDELFVKNTKSFFTVLGELKEEENNDIWWAFYTVFFYDIAKSENLETYCKYISQIGNEDAKKWLMENEDKLTEFDSWLKNR